MSQGMRDCVLAPPALTRDRYVSPVLDPYVAANILLMIASWQRWTQIPNLDGQLDLRCGLLWSWLVAWGHQHPGVRASGQSGQQRKGEASKLW